jgi:2-dehydro-3-deoxyphosphooctonate aldolase (KDO 8-P synthase)
MGAYFFVKKKLFFIAGPCVVESEKLCLSVADKLAAAAEKNSITVYFKASYDKANRTAADSFRGPGAQEGLRILQKVKDSTGLSIVTDIHESHQAKEAADVADVLQIPAYLCRQTDLLKAAGKTGKIVNIKKGQFMAPADMKYAVEKAGKKSWLTERGTFFGYNRLVVDFTGLHTLKHINVPVIFDATHSVQLPGGEGGKSGGNRDLALPLARAAVCQDVDGLFFEVHPNPDKALCDGPNSLKLDVFLKEMVRLVHLQEFLTR